MRNLTVHDFVTDAMFDFMSQIDRATHVDEVIGHVQRVLSQLGVPHFTFYSRSTDGVETADGTFPDEWITRYREQVHSIHDPVHRRLRLSPKPFEWSDLTPTEIATPMGQRVLNEAGSFGLRQGFTIPISDGNRLSGLLSFAGRQLDDDPQMLMALTMISTCAFRKYGELRGIARKAAAPLSPREVECLHWASNGKTDWEIGIILGVKESTIRSHLENARLKLNASNKVQAVAEALRMGLLAL